MIVGRLVLVGSLAGLAVACSLNESQGAFEQTYFPARHNWRFHDLYPEADHLFNAFDYGHAILYETLLSRSDRRILDARVFQHVTTDVLRHPPHVPLEERAIGPQYATMIPEVVAMFDWAHMLHRQLYDILSDTRIAPDAQEARVAQVLAYYRSRPDLALSAHPKTMDLMEGQPYSLTFRREAPRYNALIWSYHWLQMVTYDALLASDVRDSRRADIDAAIAHFWSMVEDSASHPTVMPMSAAIAPKFVGRFPEAAIVFDNLHALHDVISDILASDSIPRREKRRFALTAAAQYRDSTTAVSSREEWLEMSRAMGIEHMGGSLPSRAQRQRPHTP
jgi:hypothetical protein